MTHGTRSGGATIRALLLGSALVALAACAGGDEKMMSHGGSAQNAGAKPAAAESTVMVGGEDMFPSKTIVANAVSSKDHTTLVAAVKEAGLVDTLSSKGPFTVFAPTNEAFEALPSGTVDTLMMPEHKKQLTQVLTYHVVPGKLDKAALEQRIKAGGGKAELETANGETLTVTMNGPRNVVVEDGMGHTADITTYDVYQSNGVIHVVNKVLLPQ